MPVFTRPELLKFSPRVCVVGDQRHVGWGCRVRLLGTALGIGVTALGGATVLTRGTSALPIVSGTSSGGFRHRRKRKLSFEVRKIREHRWERRQGPKQVNWSSCPYLQPERWDRCSQKWTSQAPVFPATWWYSPFHIDLCSGCSSSFECRLLIDRCTHQQQSSGTIQTRKNSKNQKETARYRLSNSVNI